MKLHLKENPKIGDKVYAPYRDPKDSSRWELGSILDIEKNYICCQNTDAEHIHEQLYTVGFDDGTWERGILFVAEPQWYNEVEELPDFLDGENYKGNTDY